MQSEVVVKKMKSGLASIFQLAIALFVFVVNNPVLAKDYIRQCKANLYFSASTLDRQKNMTHAYPSFIGKGKVGYWAPNKARERARQNIDECLDAAWESKYVLNKPSLCTEANQIYNYPIQSGMIPDITLKACSKIPGHERLTVNLEVTYDGQQGCMLDNNSWGRKIARDFTIKCPTREFEPDVNRPGSDYRNFDLNKAKPIVCRQACLDDQPRCRAWTYVKPGSQGPKARCWLKDKVPPPMPDTCCTSGVISNL